MNDYKLCEIQIAYKPKIKASQRPKVTSSSQAFDHFYNVWDENKICLVEEFKIMLLNRANKVLGIANISQGGFSSTTADPKVILGIALKSAATSIILAHNHPSGNLMPSEEDDKLTSKICQAAKLLDLHVLDHMIITQEGYHSMADNGGIRF